MYFPFYFPYLLYLNFVQFSTEDSKQYITEELLSVSDEPVPAEINNEISNSSKSQKISSPMSKITCNKISEFSTLTDATSQKLLFSNDILLKSLINF